jgi:hypothetical protein
MSTIGESARTAPKADERNRCTALAGHFGLHRELEETVPLKRPPQNLKQKYRARKDEK